MSQILLVTGVKLHELWSYPLFYSCFTQTVGLLEKVFFGPVIILFIWELEPAMLHHHVSPASQNGQTKHWLCRGPCCVFSCVCRECWDEGSSVDLYEILQTRPLRSSDTNMSFKKVIHRWYLDLNNLRLKKLVYLWVGMWPEEETLFDIDWEAHSRMSSAFDVFKVERSSIEKCSHLGLRIWEIFLAKASCFLHFHSFERLKLNSVSPPLYWCGGKSIRKQGFKAGLLRKTV